MSGSAPETTSMVLHPVDYCRRARRLRDHLHAARRRRTTVARMLPSTARAPANPVLDRLPPDTPREPCAEPQALTPVATASGSSQVTVVPETFPPPDCVTAPGKVTETLVSTTPLKDVLLG